MTAITEQTTVGEIARQLPAAIHLLEKSGIDYCCGGSRPIGQVCQEHGLPLDQFLAGLREAIPAPAGAGAVNWDVAPLEQLMDYIVARHHGYLRAELPLLARLLEKVVTAHGGNHGSTLYPLEGVFTAFANELGQHLWKEENVLFPLIRRIELTGNRTSDGITFPISNPIRCMEHEHFSAGDGLAQMRRITGDYVAPPDGCASYQALMRGLKDLEADLHQHIHLENNILFPRALALEA